MTRTNLATHFEDLDQQHEAAALGMWTFLATEVLFFGGMFTGYIVYRTDYPQGFYQASHHMDLMLGSINTAVLLTSSFTMALAVHAARRGSRRGILIGVSVTMILGAVFLAIKFTEYAHKFQEHLVPGKSFHLSDLASIPGAELFFSFYFAMTGLHALHMIVGLGVMTTMLVMAARGRFTPEHHPALEMAGLYWHFVDIIWIFLYPLFYLTA